MFPTSGFFRSHNCPYYLSGLCERPYCHFRHMKQEDRLAQARPAQTALKYQSRPSEQPVPSAPASRHSSGRSRSRHSASQSESDNAAATDELDYTPTPLSILRRAKAQQPAQEAPPEPVSYEPTPLTIAPPSVSSESAPTSRRRPLQLPAPKTSGIVSNNSVVASGSVGEAYEPISNDAAEAKRTRYSPAAEPSYEPTPIASGAGCGVNDDNEDDDDAEECDDDEYCPSAVAPPAASASTDKPPEPTASDKPNDGGGGGEIKRVLLDLFGEEPANASAVETAARDAAKPTAASAAPATSSATVSGQLGKASAAVRRLTPSEQVARRAQQLAVNPSALSSQGKVRAPSAAVPAAASSGALIIAVAASPLPGTVANKIPDVVRQRYLDRLAEECRLAASTTTMIAEENSGQAASRRAQQLELECYERSANRNVYLNSVILAIKKVRSTSASSQLGQKPKHQQQPEEASQLSDKKFHKHLLKYAMTPEQLAENRYPPHLPPLPYPPPANPLERLCVRCGAAFLLQLPDMTTPAGQCCYHYGRAYSRRVPGAGVQQIYSCCGGDLQAKGCSLGERHVHEYNVYCDTDGYRETQVPDKATVSKKQRRAVYALDCEMIYTDAGKELARVTVIDRSLSVVYDRLVHPSAPIVDCNTRFSGLRAEQLQSAQHRLVDVQDELLKMIYSTTVLIGHSLESDLQVLKLRHATVVDTSIVFPHRQGLPKKRALRNLASEILNKIIQTGGDAGHDSSEDARTCMELMFHKLTEDLKKGKFSSPG